MRGVVVRLQTSHTRFLYTNKTKKKENRD